MAVDNQQGVSRWQGHNSRNAVPVAMSVVSDMIEQRFERRHIADQNPSTRRTGESDDGKHHITSDDSHADHADYAGRAWRSWPLC